MRVISGTAKGTKLNSIENLSTRPTLDRVKEALFNILQQNVDNSSEILDLFAGSGALGIECLSRGAKSCTFCDKSYEDIKMLKQNIARTRFEEKATVVSKDYKSCLEELRKQQKQFNVIFIDPPYKLDIAVDSLKRILDYKLLAKNGIIVIETDEEERELKEIENLEKQEEINIDIKDVRKYGRVKLIFLHERG